MKDKFEITEPLAVVTTEGILLQGASFEALVEQLHETSFDSAALPLEGFMRRTRQTALDWSGSPVRIDAGAEAFLRDLKQAGMIQIIERAP